MKFYDETGKCVIIISENNFKKISWTTQCYTLKNGNDLEELNLYDGRLELFFDSKKILSVVLIDFISSRAYPLNDPSLNTIKGTVVMKNDRFCLSNIQYSASLHEFISNKKVHDYLKTKNVLVE